MQVTYYQNAAIRKDSEGRSFLEFQLVALLPEQMNILSFSIPSFEDQDQGTSVKQMTQSTAINLPD